MAIPKQKTHTLREQPTRIVPPLPEPAQAFPEPLDESEQRPTQGSRLTLTLWLLAFTFLCSLVLWDVITALLFR